MESLGYPLAPCFDAPILNGTKLSHEELGISLQQRRSGDAVLSAHLLWPGGRWLSLRPPPQSCHPRAVPSPAASPSTRSENAALASATKLIWVEL